LRKLGARLNSQPPMPTNLPAERTVLGALIEEDGLLSVAISEGLIVDDFSISDHRRIFGAMLELREKDCPIDYISVADQLGNAPADFALLGDLISGIVIERGHVLHHIRIVRKKARLRTLLKLADWMSKSAIEVAANPDVLVQIAIKRLEEVPL
jgi:replicative DNA helicase